MGLAGALALGGIVFYINADHGFWPGITAALKQGTYTFFAGGLLMRLVENLALRFDNRFWAYAAAVIIPTLLSVGLTFLVHSLRGTPEPLHSVIPTAILSPPSFSWWTWVKRNRKVRFTHTADSLYQD